MIPPPSASRLSGLPAPPVPPASRGRRAAALLLALCLPLVSPDCASAPPREARLRQEIAQGRYREAARTAAGERDELLRHLDRALALFHAGDAGVSNLYFGRAEALAEERYTRSLTRAAVSLLLNDTVLPYQPDGWERLLIPLYRSLNFAALDNAEDAAVEARRLSAALLARRDEHPSHAGEEGDAFLYVLAGAVLEWAGRPDDSAVAYRNAREAYGSAAAPPEWLPASQGTAADTESAGRPERVASTRGVPTLASPHATASPGSITGAQGAGGAGELVVLVESGLVAPPLEKTLLVFLPEDEAKRARDDPDAVGAEVAKRVLARNEDDDQGHGRLGYLLPLALRTRPLPPVAPARAELEVDGRRVELPVAFDLSRAAALAYQDELPALLAKTAARALVKTLAFKETTDDEKPLVRILANALHLATERADTRAWISLPGELRFARLPLAAGAHDLRVRIWGPGGARTVDLPAVRVESGRPTLVTARLVEPGTTAWPSRD